MSAYTDTFDTWGFFKSGICIMGRVFFPALLAAVIAGVSYQLIADAGAFFGSFWKAFFLEAGALALIAWKPENWLKLLRAAALLAAFGLVIVASGMHAARPHLEDSGLSTVDRMKLQALEDSIEAHKAAVAAVKGQPRNSAMRAGDLSEAIAARDAFLASVEPDLTIVAENRLAAMTAVLYRVALQLINWLLAHWLISIIAGRIQPQTDEREPGRLIALPQSNGPFEKFEGDEARVLEWILDRGETTRAALLASRLLKGQRAYDRALDRLIHAGAVSLEAAGPMASWVYTAKMEGGRATA